MKTDNNDHKSGLATDTKQNNIAILHPQSLLPKDISVFFTPRRPLLDVGKTPGNEPRCQYPTRHWSKASVIAVIMLVLERAMARTDCDINWLDEWMSGLVKEPVVVPDDIVVTFQLPLLSRSQPYPTHYFDSSSCHTESCLLRFLSAPSRMPVRNGRVCRRC